MANDYTKTASQPMVQMMNDLVSTTFGSMGSIATPWIGLWQELAKNDLSGDEVFKKITSAWFDGANAAMSMALFPWEWPMRMTMAVPTLAFTLDREQEASKPKTCTSPVVVADDLALVCTDLARTGGPASATIPASHVEVRSLVGGRQLIATIQNLGEIRSKIKSGVYTGLIMTREETTARPLCVVMVYFE